MRAVEQGKVEVPVVGLRGLGTLHHPIPEEASCRILRWLLQGQGSLEACIVYLSE